MFAVRYTLNGFNAADPFFSFRKSVRFPVQTELSSVGFPHEVFFYTGFIVKRRNEIDRFPIREKVLHLTEAAKSVAVIITVLNEESNIAPIFSELKKIESNTAGWKLTSIVFADGGSTDNTGKEIEAQSGQMPGFSVITRSQKLKPGTAPATIEAADSVNADWIVVMDGDLQHPIYKIPELLNAKSEGYDVVVASRYVEGGIISRTATRGAVSKGAEFLCRHYVKSSGTLADPLSGFFVTDAYRISSLTPVPGLYKLLLYVLASSGELKSKEVPYSFGRRIHGKSKLTAGSTHFIRRYLKELSFYKKTEKAR